MDTYRSCRSRALAVHHRQVRLRRLLRTSSHYRRSSAPLVDHSEWGRTRSVGMHPDCCTHLDHNHIHLVVVEHRSCPAVAHSRARGTRRSARRCVGSQISNGSRVHPIQHTMVGRLVVVAASAVEVGIESSPAVVVAVGSADQSQ
jgi:hypothetical protein